MAQKGTKVLIDPAALIPAVTLFRMVNGDIEAHAIHLRKALEEAENSGYFRGERLSKVAECVAGAHEALVRPDGLVDCINKLKTATQVIYDKYLTAETRSAIDRNVASALEKLQSASTSANLTANK